MFMSGRFFIAVSVFALGVVLAGSARAQIGSSALAGGLENLEILGLSVEGVTDEYTRSFVLQSSRLVVGQRVTIPGDPAFGDAIRAIYRLGTYADVQIVEERRVGQGVFLLIRVKKTPSLREYSFTGIGKGAQKDLRKEIPLYTRAAVRQNSIARATQIIKEYYAEKGRPLAKVDVTRTDHEDNTSSLDFAIDRGPKVKVGRVIIGGNESLTDKRVRRFMKTRKPVWWKFWHRGIYKEDVFDEDLDRIIEKYSERGYYDARIVRDSVFLDQESGKKPKMIIELDVKEGPQYFVRNIEWDGNTIYSDETLTNQLGFVSGDRFNTKRLDEKLYGVGKDNDVSSLYMNSGYMRFNVNPRISVVGTDSLDLTFDIFEGDIFRYGDVSIAGNRKTREHVIRRELITIPGNRFSRNQIQESIRRLMQMNYFTQESLAAGPSVELRPEKKQVDLKYNLEEQGSDQLELSGTWGRFGIILQLRFGFNNFSAQNIFKKGAWRPLPSGDGQKLSLSVQTNGRRYQQYSISFTEPWFRGRPTPLGISLSYSKISLSSFRTTSTGNLLTFSVRTFYEQRLQWPDQYFSTSSTIGYQYFDNNDYISTLPLGISSEITFKQSLMRNSVDNPIFPTSGSKFLLSLEIAPPFANLIQYHKWRLNTSWNIPLLRRVSIGVGVDAGYIGTLTGEEVQFERFVLGGSPFETQGFFNFFGKDIVYMRAYPLGALGPRIDDDPFGGRILNKFTSELRWNAVQGQQLQAAPYLFIDAGNSWDNFQSYNPSEIFRSAGFGARIALPILGMVELTYGYNFDSFEPINSSHNGTQKWTFQFSLGQGFGM
ncbi:MAG: outer membrane protein assembly factor BamA [Bacteroidetes bacterium]|nr:MAG: outer membrane protein assembly factor BamA [Bacteroidota bacterium]